PAQALAGHEVRPRQRLGQLARVVGLGQRLRRRRLLLLFRTCSQEHDRKHSTERPCPKSHPRSLPSPTPTSTRAAGASIRLSSTPRPTVTPIACRAGLCDIPS